MFVDALKYPFKQDSYVKTLLIGTLLLITSFLIVPLFILLGYFVKVVHSAINDEPLPRFQNYIELLTDGAKLFLIPFGYGVLLMLAMMAVSLGGSINETLGLILFLILVPLYLLLLYSPYAVIYQFAKEKSLRKAFNFKEIGENLFTIQYLKVFLLITVVGQLLFTIAQVLIGITIIGLLLIPTTLVYEMMVYGHLTGQIEE